jgi:two-component system chemotaxis sensor kinase CheA
MGTKIRLKLPLTLAIIEGLLVGVGDGFFVLPVSYIEECVEVKGNEDGYGGQGNRLLNIRDKLVQCISLRNLYETGGKGSAVEQAVIVNMGSQQVGLVVDNVVGEMQAVMKNLGSVYRKTEGISGATILGDGQIALIVDVPQLVEGVERREMRQTGV